MAEDYSKDAALCTRALNFVVLLDVSEGFFGWARGNLRSDFSDVTLACDDGSLQAHKVLRWPLNQHSRTEGQKVAKRILDAVLLSHWLGKVCIGK